MRSWSRRRIVVSVCAGLFVVWLVAVAWTLLGARSAMTAGAADLRDVRRNASIATLVEPESRDGLQQAQDHFDDADSKLDSPVLWPLKVVPVVSRQVRASQQLAESAQRGTKAADAALAEMVELTQRSRKQGPERVQTLRDLAAVAERTDVALDGVDPGSTDGLYGPLGDAVAELSEQRDQAQQGATRMHDTTLAVADVLEGPESYLLLGANNAEMRNGSGMFLSASELSFDDGRLSLGEVRPTADLVLPEGSVPVTGDLAANWPWLDPGRDLRNLGLTADFPASAELAVQNWASVPGGGPVAGAIVLDVDGIRALLRVVGPVEVDGTTYTADNVRGELLRNQYQRYDGNREERRDQLGGVANAIFDRLEAGEWKLEDLATELSDAVAGRHLMVWSSDPAAARAWHDVGADGHLTERSVSVGLLNRGATKLDSWIDTAAEVTTGEAEGGRRSITITYDIVNTAPVDGPQYVIGPNVEGVEVGDHPALVVVNLPAGTTDVEVAGAELFLQGGDGPTVVVGGRVLVPRGKTVRVTVTAMLAEGVDRLTLEPSARIEHTVWTVNGRTYEQDRRRSIDLD